MEIFACREGASHALTLPSSSCKLSPVQLIRHLRVTTSAYRSAPSTTAADYACPQSSSLSRERGVGPASEVRIAYRDIIIRRQNPAAADFFLRAGNLRNDHRSVPVRQVKFRMTPAVRIRIPHVAWTGIPTCCVSLAALLCCSVVSPQLSDAASRRCELRLLAVHLSSFILHGSVG